MCTAIILRAGFIFLLCISASARSQQQGDAGDPALFEHLLDADSETDPAPMLEEIDRLRENPLCLAKADRTAIASLPFLDAASVDTLIAVLKSDVLTWADIARALDEDASRYALLRACTVLNCEEAGPPRLQAAVRSRFQQDDQPRAGFLDGSWHASRARLYQRLRVGIGKHVQAAVLVEKDPGERLLTDHASGYVSIEDLGHLRRLVLGDLSVTAGQGLVFWQGFAMAKTSQATGVQRSPRLLRPVATSSEGGGARGVGLQLDLTAVDAVLILSSSGRDATVDQGSGTAGSFAADGLHRSASEEQRAGRVREDLAGMHVRSRRLGSGLQAGCSLVASRYSLPASSPTPFSFAGDRAWCGGMDMRWDGGRVSLVCEAARSHTHAGALLAGLEARLSPQVRLSLLYRRYDADFVSLHGSGFGERSGSTQNEEGLYCGLRCRPVRGLRIELWADVFRFPNRTATIDLPASGGELRLSAAYRPYTHLELGLRLRREQKQQAVAAQDLYGRALRPLTLRSNSGLRIDLQYKASEELRLRLRADYVHVAYDDWRGTAAGSLLAADMLWRPHPRLMLAGSLSAYHSDDWEARLFRFERDVRGVMRSVACDGEGVRSYLLCVVALTDRLEVSGRYALTVRDGARSLGTGRDAVTGDRLGTLSLQADWEY
ncbi:MAG: hypothetical protein RRA94_09350 [Bacteroidota bacterium]|nr:hypothetical protein [Bacteroidota bacterium]